ncbi:hypothetical protein [Embleya hyalina]|uniref:Lipoprotein n=1 Tax=Embleya hyalina TaxID=516124 RepID=A0A401YQY7_9ACTN|nr:hypothetical protein [Embleya hyalina]GCD97003.1 hypothetical protein EHYA_04690 [Embleya hyalina]
MRSFVEATTRRRSTTTLVAALATTAVLALGGCGNKDDTPSAAPSTASTSATSAPSPSGTDRTKPTSAVTAPAKPTGVEFPAQVAGHQRLEQKNAPKVSSLVGLQNALHTKGLTQVQTAVFGPSADNEAKMVFVSTGQPGQLGPQAYVEKISFPQAKPVDTGKVTSPGAFRCWATTGADAVMMCLWGDEKNFLAMGTATGYASTQELIDALLTVRRQMFGL